MLGRQRRCWPTLKQHWLNALCLLGGVTALRPNAHAVHTANVAKRHQTDLINQLERGRDRGGLVDPVNCIYMQFTGLTCTLFTGLRVISKG